MDSSEQEEMKQVILEKIEDTEQEIEQLKELTKPIQPDAAYGRLSRMDAINNKTINDAALREQKSRLQKLQRALEKLEKGNYGTCVKCGDSIPLGRLKFMPWTTKCVKCA
ncbi:MAG: TraR/DksA C4-type zinc finger protein [Balneolaceae bacterium]|nr:TraR/DksA C4-type zinc finger protein [Balneolaceae bacterium]